MIPINNLLSNSIILECSIHVCCVSNNSFPITYHLFHVFLYIRKLLDNLDESSFFKHDNYNISLSNIFISTQVFFVDNVMIYHLATFEVSLNCPIENDAGHNEIYIVGILTWLGKVIIFLKFFRFKLFKILGVKVITTVLEKSVHVDS
jgi:hypothetical protein